MGRPVLFTRKADVEPHEDYGFFGPDSITWRVWSYPTSLTVGFQRSVVIEELDPALVASVDATHAIFDRPRTRYDRTLRYFALVAFGGSKQTSTAADVLVKVHSKGQGIEPLSGVPYDANDPDSQLWIHLTAWHSILYAYERFGPGKLSTEDEAQYWEECATAAELQTIRPEDVPRSRDGVRAYFEKMRPQLVASDVAKRTMRHLLRADVMLPPLPRPLRPGARAIASVLRAATISTMPKWMRAMSDIDQPRIVDVLVRPVMRVSFWLVGVNPHVELAALSYLSPGTVPVVAPIFLKVAPEREEVVTPTQARERYGFDAPVHAHEALRAKQREKALAGAAVSDEGIIESEPILGSTA